MKIYLIAGEASGDLHGANLAREMLRQQPGLQLRGWGGDRMSQAGVHVVKHYRELAFMGFTEVVMNLRTIARNFKTCKADIEAFAPQAIIFIDYPGFNLRMAQWAHSRGYRTLYYISPQVWAWKESRVKKIKDAVERMYVVLPFEKDFFARHGVEVDFVGHPLLDEISQWPPQGLESFCQRNQLPAKPIIALLPGSRRQEISTMLPIMLSVRQQFPEFQFVVAGAPSIGREFYAKVMGNANTPVLFGETYHLLKLAVCGMVTSGTATLEAGLFRMPQVVCYKGGRISYLIARRLIKVKYISLVNLILDAPVVTELIQDQLTENYLTQSLRELLPGQSGRDKLLLQYEQLAHKLGGAGASAKAANLMLKRLQSST